MARSAAVEVTLGLDMSGHHWHGGTSQALGADELALDKCTGTKASGTCR